MRGSLIRGSGGGFPEAGRWWVPYSGVMASVRPLREVLADLVGDTGARTGGPEAYLAEQGHAELPPELMAEAVVNFADTAPPEVAEQLAPFVTAHTAGQSDAGEWFDLLTSASVEAADDLDGLAEAPETWSSDFDQDPGPGLDFGTGAEIDFPASELASETPEPVAPTDWPVSDEPIPAEPTTSDTITGDVIAAEEPDEDSLD